MENTQLPVLTEPGIISYLNLNLKKCHLVKHKYYNQMFNLILLGLFVSILGSLILYKYKGKLTPEEMEQRELEKYKYILNKIKITQESSLQEKQRLLSGQPLWVENVY